MISQYGSTPLHWAAKEGHTEIASLLIGNGADINSKNNDGLTSLHCAVDGGYKQIVSLLIGNGAEINSETKVNISIYI